MRYRLLPFVFLACMGIHAQEVNQYIPGQTPEGIVYYLPKTIIKVDVTATKTDYTPGELCQYAERYLHTQAPGTEPACHWQLEDIRAEVIGVPDSSKVYAVKVKEKSVSSNIELTDDGIVKAINTTSPKEEPAPAPAQGKKKVTADVRSLMTQDMLMAGSTAKLAELVAQEIYSIRESKSSLVRGQADYMPQDGAALSLMLDNLEAQEDALTSMFTGTQNQSTKTFSFYVEPKDDINNEMIFRFSEKLGVLDTENLAGQSFTISVKDLNALPEGDEHAKAKRKKLEGIIYNIPGKALVTLKSVTKTYFEGELPVTQFGETESLVDNLFTFKNNTRVIFNPTTGAVVKIDKDM